MKLIIDGIDAYAAPGQTLLDIIDSLNLNTPCLLDRPIAAKIAGEVFNLNYIPVRVKLGEDDRASVRRAMQASGGVVDLIRYQDPAGKDVYNRTVQFVLFLALHQLWPSAKVKMDCLIGNALFVEVYEAHFSADLLKKRVSEIIAENVPLIRNRLPLKEAIDYFEASCRDDVTQLLKRRKTDYFDLYTHDGFSDYYYGELAPSTGYVQVWDILPVDGGFMFLFPDAEHPDRVSDYASMPNFLAVCKEGERWCELMECQSVSDLNALAANGRIRELIRVNEALHEKRFSQVADMVCEGDVKIVLLAGPSSSGKTTSANRLATQLRVYGKKPILMSLDDYYLDRDMIPVGPDGKRDLEHINTIDTDLFAEHIQALLNGETVQIPSFNFKSGKRVWAEHYLTLTEETVIIVEGLHALNPLLLPESIDRSKVFKLYVTPLLPLNLDNHNRISSGVLRLLRRTVRDYNTRGASVQQTMQMWDSVRRGEKRWIFPFQEEADVIFNSSTLYELAVLKKYIYPLLLKIQPEEFCYEQVRSLVKVLNYVQEADVDDEIPPTSIVREFIGGNRFYV